MKGLVVMKSNLIKYLPIIILATIGLLMSISLITMAVFNQLIADDVSYFRYFQQNTPWDFLYWHYFEHTGRFLQSVLISTGYLIAGDNSVKIMPLIIYLLLAVVSSWALHRFLPWKKKTVLTSSISGLAFASTAVILMPSVYDSYLWWTSSSIYLASLVVLIFNICTVDTLIKGVAPKIHQYLLLFVMVLGQTLSEITSVIMTGTAALLLIFYLYKKNRSKIIVFLKVFLSLTIGFFLTYFSPGSIVRRQSEDGGSIGFDFSRVFILSTRHTFELISSLSLWEISLMISAGIIIGILIKRVSRKQLKTTLWTILAVIFIGLYGSFCINNYVWYSMPLRALTLPSFILTGSIIATIAVLSNYISYKYRKNTHLPVLQIVSIGVFTVVALIGFAKLSHEMVSFVMTRDAAYHQRESHIKERLETPSGAIKIEALPILTKSEATDLMYNSDEQVWWYEGALKAHNNISAEKEVDVIAPPNNYCLFGRDDNGACTPRGDNTTLRSVLKKVDNFMVYYFTMGY